MVLNVDVMAGGPFFEDLSVGDTFDPAPALTLTDGRAAVHQAIVGDRLRLPLNTDLSRRVTGEDGALAHPAFVWDVVIGQSTVATQRVIANLFYRGLIFRRTPQIGDTLVTRTKVVGLRQNRPKRNRAASGLAALRVTTVDQDRRPVLDFWRCAMLPLRDAEARTGHDDDLEAVGTGVLVGGFAGAVEPWRLDAFRAAVPGGHADALVPGTSIVVSGGDVVSSAPELARLTLNVAAVHHDDVAGERLVYGGHTIGIALAQTCRALPDLVTVVAWHSCHHLGPVREGDTLSSTVSVEEVERPATPSGGALAHLRSVVEARGRPGEAPRPVLDWRYVAVFA
jgi:acyl dehydratase